MLELRKSKINKIDYLTYFNFFFILAYLLPAILLSLNFSTYATKYALINNTNVDNCLFSVSVVIGYCSYVAGYFLKLPRYFGSKILIQKNVKHNYDIIFAFILTVISIIAFIIYVFQFGGLQNAISLASLIRSGVIEGGSLEFSKHFIQVSLYSFCICVYYLIFHKPKNKLFLASICIFISAIVFGLYILIYAGRGVFITMFIIIYSLYVIEYNKLNVVKFILIILVGIYVIMYGDLFFQSLSSLKNGDIISTYQYFLLNAKESTFNILKTLGSQQYALVSLDIIIDRIGSTEHSYRFFLDWIYGLFTLIPTRLVNFPFDVPESISHYNTLEVIGKFERTVPPGLFAYALWSLDWVGLIMYPFLIGCFSRFLNTVFYLNKDNMNCGNLIYVFIGIDFIIPFINGDPVTYIRWLIPPSLFYLYFLCYSNQISVKRFVVKY